MERELDKLAKVLRENMDIDYIYEIIGIKKMMNIILAVILDFILGDPYSFPHPVKLMGNIISREEKKLQGKLQIVKRV